MVIRTKGGTVEKQNDRNEKVSVEILPSYTTAVFRQKHVWLGNPDWRQITLPLEEVEIELTMPENVTIKKCIDKKAWYYGLNGNTFIAEKCNMTNGGFQDYITEDKKLINISDCEIVE